MNKVKSLGKIGVLYGGWAAEREISLRSGQAIYEALQSIGADVQLIDVQKDFLASVQKWQIDFAFNALHGRGGEDGQVQAVLEVAGIPYTGSGVLASALSMDKVRTKQLWMGVGLPTPGFVVASDDLDVQAVVKRLGLPLIVKPSHEGSSIGMARVNSADELQQAVNLAKQYDSDVLIEAWVTGAEYTVAILGDRALPVIRLQTPNEFYDFDAKYQANTTQYLCPCGLESDQEANMQELAVSAFKALGASGWGRVDVMLDQQQNPWLLELNSVPGMTDHSLVPMAAKAAGYSFAELVEQILLESTAKGDFHG